MTNMNDGFIISCLCNVCKIVIKMTIIKIKQLDPILYSRQVQKTQHQKFYFYELCLSSILLRKRTDGNKMLQNK